MAVQRLPRHFIQRIDTLQELNDDELVRRYRFDRQSILYICGLLENGLAPVTNRTHAVTTVSKVLTTLRYLATGKFQLCNADDHGMSQPTVSRVITQTLDALSTPQIVRQFIKFPATPQEIRRHQRRFYNVAGFPGVVGVIDGTHVQIVAPLENENEFVNRHHYHSINTQVVFDSDDKIIDIVARWPGSTHDSRILANSGLYRLFETANALPARCHILGDSGYPCRRWLLTPFLRPQPGPQANFNRAHKRTRSSVERGIGQLKRRFHVLHGEIRLSPKKSCKVITACAVLHNISKARNVPLPDGGPVGQIRQPDGGPVIFPPAAAPVAGLRYREQFAANHFQCVKGMAGSSVWMNVINSFLLFVIWDHFVISVPVAPFCPAGYIYYQSLNWCCVPIAHPNYCGKDRYIKRCEVDHGADKCVPCQSGYTKFENSTSQSDTQDRCYKIPDKIQCTEENKWIDDRCVCNIQEGYVNTRNNKDDCKKANKCETNTYLLENGSCAACPTGTHREGPGYGPCELDDQSTTTADRQLHQVTMTTSKTPSTTTTASMEPTVVEKNETTLEEIDKVSPPSEGLSTVIIIIIVVSVILAVVLLILVLVVYLVKNQRRSNKLSTGNQRPGVESNQNLIELADRPSDSEPSIELNNSNTGEEQHGLLTPPSSDPPSYTDNPPAYPPSDPMGVSRNNNQMAVPYSDDPAQDAFTYNDDSVQGTSLSQTWPTLESENPSSGQQDVFDVHSPDQTVPKLMGTGQLEFDPTSSPQHNAPPKSSVCPVGKTDPGQPEALLRSAPTLDTGSFRNESGHDCS